MSDEYIPSARAKATQSIRGNACTVKPAASRVIEWEGMTKRSITQSAMARGQDKTVSDL